MHNKRDTLKKIATINAVASVYPNAWVKPIINSVVLPAHATTSLCENITPAPAFKFNIVDGRTGEDLNPVATVIISNNDVVIEAQKIESDGSLELFGYVPSPGFYDFTLSAPGYRDFRYLGIHTAPLIIPECNHYNTLEWEFPLNK